MLRASSPFVLLDPPHSALAVLAVDGGECDWRWVAPGLLIAAEAEKGVLPPLNPRTERRTAWAGGELLPYRLRHSTPLCAGWGVCARIAATCFPGGS